MAMIANNIRPGNVLVYKNNLWAVSRISHTQPGKGGAFIQVEMKDIKNGTKLNERFRSTENVEKAHLDTQEYQFLYMDGEQLTLMNLADYEQIHVEKTLVGEPVAFLEDGMNVNVTMHEQTIVAIELPENVVGEIAETEAVVKGQTAASSNKPATLTNGVRVMVPPFIGAGDKIVVKSADGEYVERVKK